MPFAKLRQDYTALPKAPSAAPLTADLERATPADSPAIALQRQLSHRVATVGHPAADKWSARRSLALIVSASAALWMAIIMSGAEAVKLLA